MPDETQEQTRREFISACLRYPAAGGLALLAAVLGARRQGNGDGEEACTRNSVCSGCPTLSRCVLPQALSRRQADRMTQQ